MPIHQQLFQWHIAEGTDGCICDVCPQRTARINVLKQKINRVLDPHFVPHPDAHGSSFFRINRVTPEIFLVKPKIDFIDPTKEPNEGGLRSEGEPEQM